MYIQTMSRIWHVMKIEKGFGQKYAVHYESHAPTLKDPGKSDYFHYTPEPWERIKDVSWL